MQKILFALLALSCFVSISCVTNEEEPEIGSVQYGRNSIILSWAEVYQDTTRFRDPWVWNFTLVDTAGYETSPEASETVWNCNKQIVQRNGDTVFLKAFKKLSSEIYETSQLLCLDSFDVFILDKDGNGKHQGAPLEQDPNVRVRGDSLLFDMTVLFLDKGVLTPMGVPPVVRDPQYGTFQNLDSLATEIFKYPDDTPDLIESPKFKVAWQTWVYLKQ